MRSAGLCLFAVIFSIIQGTWTQECDPSWNNTTTTTRLSTKQRRKTNQHADEVNPNTLRLVHVVFRHGDRAADDDSLYPKDPYLNFTYYPVGYGQLTNLGKKQEYKIGVSLRERYDLFLGKIYTPEVLDARSTDVNRTKMSLELALAGLWPPAKEQMWNNELPWLPIPYNYWHTNEDTLIGDPLVTCPVYKKLYEKNVESEENVSENEKLKSFYNYVNYHTGLNATEPMDIYNIYFTLRAEEGWGLELPEWTRCVWPHKFLEVALKQYDIFTQTPELTGLSAGMLIDKIVRDSEHVISHPKFEGTKMYLYSGHERNVAFTLIALGVYSPHMPPYGSYVIIELHEIDEEFGVKVFYQDYSEDEPKLLTIPGCDSFCPFSKFYSLVEHNLPRTSCFE